MSGLAERHAMQRIGPLSGGQRPDDGIGQRSDRTVEYMSALNPFGEGYGPGDRAKLAPHGNGGLPHTFMRTRNDNMPTMTEGTSSWEWLRTLIASPAG
jgi:hypothetical protein